MYSDKIFPRPFPPVCQFFHPFLRLAPPPLSLFPLIVSFFPVRATAAKSRFVLFPRRPTFLYCAGDCFPHLPVLCRRFLFRALLSPAALSLFCPFPLPSLFSCPPPPDFPVLCRRCPVCLNFPVFFDGIDKKAGYVLLFFGQSQRGGQCLRHCPPKSIFKLSFLSKNPESP